jgi:hypothetical protein
MPDELLVCQIWVLQICHDVLQHRCHRWLTFIQFKLVEYRQQVRGLESCLVLVSYKKFKGILYVIDL